jgi:hypothetical protein
MQSINVETAQEDVLFKTELLEKRENYCMRFFVIPPSARTGRSATHDNIPPRHEQELADPGHGHGQPPLGFGFVQMRHHVVHLLRDGNGVSHF